MEGGLSTIDLHSLEQQSEIMFQSHRGPTIYLLYVRSFRLLAVEPTLSAWPALPAAAVATYPYYVASGVQQQSFGGAVDRPLRRRS